AGVKRREPIVPVSPASSNRCRTCDLVRLVCAHRAHSPGGWRAAAAAASPVPGERRRVSPVSVDAPAPARRHPATCTGVPGSTRGSIRMAVIAAETHEALSGISGGDVKLLDEAMGLRESELTATGL